MDADNKNVFINCPFDKEYEKYLRAMMFAIAYCGYKPKLATLDRNAGQTRIQKIQEMIRDWFYEQTVNRDKFPSGTEVWNAYHDCMAAMNNDLGKRGVKDLKPQEFLDKICCYIEET